MSRRTFPSKNLTSRRIFGLAMVALGLLLLQSFFPSIQLEVTRKVEGTAKAPNWNLTDTDNKTWTLRSFEGKKVVLIDLMAISCESCKIVMENLKKVYVDQDKDKVFFITVDVWNTVDSIDDLRKLKKEENFPWPIALDTDNLLTKYSAQNIAKIVIIDANGYAVFQNEGVTTEAVIREKLKAAVEGSLKPIEMNPVSLWVLAIFAGFASFFSPCAFPMFPGYMAYYFKKNIEQKDQKLNVGKAAASGTVSALGIIVVYVIIGALVVLAGSAIIPYVSKLQLIIGIILLFLGALMMTNIQYDRIVAPFRKAFSGVGKGKDGQKKDMGFYAGLFIYGAGYGGAASACTLPVFLAVILAGIASGSLLTGMLLLIVYTLIAALLMILVTVAIAVVGHQAVQKLAKYTNLIKKISGFVLLIAGVYLILFWLAANGYVDIPYLT